MDGDSVGKVDIGKVDISEGDIGEVDIGEVDQDHWTFASTERATVTAYTEPNPAGALGILNDPRLPGPVAAGGRR